MPSTCPLRDGNGCYAESGPLRLVWERASTPWHYAMAKIRRLPGGSLLRCGQAGVLPGHGNRIDEKRLFELVDAARRLEVIAYTHKPVLGDTLVARHNRELIQRALKAGFLVSVSADNPGHADWLSELGVAPVVTIVANVYARRKRAETIPEWRDRIADLPVTTPGGRRLALCTATYTDTTCEECRVCARPRGVIVAFPAHCGRWRQVEQTTGARDPRVAPDVPAGQRWASSTTGRWPRSSPTSNALLPSSLHVDARRAGRAGHRFGDCRSGGGAESHRRHRRDHRRRRRGTPDKNALRR